MHPPNPDKVLEYLEVLANFEGTKRTGMEGYHDYYEQAGYAAERIREMRADAVYGLILGLQSDNEEIRYHALRLIREIGDSRAHEALTELSKTENNQRNRELIHKALASLGAHQDVDNLTQDLQSDDVEVRLNAVRQLGKHKNAIGLPALVRALQEDSDEAVRNEVAIIIGAERILNSYRVIDPLVDMLQIEESPQVRANIALALGQNNAVIRRTVQALLAHAIDEPNEQVRNSIRSALQSNPSVPAISTLIRNLKHPELESLITSTLAIYGKGGLLKDDNFGKIDLLIEWMNKTLSSGDISTEQAKNLSHMSSALASVGTFKVIEPILRFIDAGIQPYSHYAIEHLGQIKDVNATVALESLLDSDDSEIRLKALTVLSRNPSESMIQTIQDYGKREDLTDAEQAIIQKLSVKETPIEADPLQALKDEMQSSNMQTRLKALSKLSKEEHGLPILLEALKYDSHSKVRAEAANTIGLSQMRNPDVIPHLIEAMQTDPKRNVREAAIQGLSYNKTNHEQISTAILARIPEEPVNTHDAILYALTKHPNPLAIPFALESITNPKLSLRAVELLKVYVRRGWVTQDMIAPAIEWKNSLGDFESLDRVQQVAFTEFEAILESLDASD